MAWHTAVSGLVTDGNGLSAHCHTVNRRKATDRDVTGVLVAARALQTHFQSSILCLIAVS